MRIFIATLLACAFATTPAAAAWTEVATPHYLLFGDASRGDMLRIAKRFEQFHAVMQQVLPKAVTAFASPTVVLVFKDARSFRPYLPLYADKPVEVGGYALTGGPINYIGMNAQGGSDAYRIIFHELAHLLTRNVLQNAAVWFSEGVAEYYSTFELVNETEARLGLPIGRHVTLLRQQFMPLAEVLAVDASSAAYNEQDRATSFYAASWTLVHLLRNNESTRGRFAEYMALTESGSSQEEAVTKGFGVPLVELERALRSYVQQLTMVAQKWTLATPIKDTDLIAREVNDGTVLPHLASVLLHFKRSAEAEQRATAALLTAPRSAQAHAVLAAVALQRDRPADAKEWLTRDMAFNGFFDDYLVASVLSRYVRQIGPSTNEGREAAAALQSRVKAATTARTDVADAWRLAAESHLLQRDSVQALAAIERGVALAPANDSYRFLLADALVATRAFERARSVLGGLMARGTPEVKADARRMMAAVVAYERALSASTMRGDAAPRPPPRSDEPAPPSSRLIPDLRPVAPGETRVFGRLTAIECGPQGIALAVQMGAHVLRVRVTKMDVIDFITYRQDLTGQVTCGARSPADPVYVTWKGPSADGDNVQTDALVVEFMPVGYVP